MTLAVAKGAPDVEEGSGARPAPPRGAGFRPQGRAAYEPRDLLQLFGRHLGEILVTEQLLCAGGQEQRLEEGGVGRVRPRRGRNPRASVLGSGPRSADGGTDASRRVPEGRDRSSLRSACARTPRTRSRRAEGLRADGPAGSARRGGSRRAGRPDVLGGHDQVAHAPRAHLEPEAPQQAAEEEEVLGQVACRRLHAVVDGSRQAAAHVVEVVLVLQDDAEGVVDHRRIEGLLIEADESGRPVQGLGHPGPLEELRAPQLLDEGGDLAREPLRAHRGPWPSRSRARSPGSGTRSSGRHTAASGRRGRHGCGST